MFSALLYRVGMLLGNFLMVILVARIWGATGKGETTLFLANVVLASMLCQVIAGNAVAYFAQRLGEGKVRFLAYLWTVFTGICISFFFNFFLFPTEYAWYFVGFLLFENLLFVHLHLFISHRKYGWFNAFSLLKIIIPLLVFLVIYGLKIHVELEFFFLISMMTLMLLWIASFRFSKLEWVSFSEIKTIGVQMFRYGWQSQGGILLTFLRQRYSYYIIGAMLSMAHLGVYSVAIAIVEASLALTRSLGVVLFGELIHTEKGALQIALTRKTMRISSALTLLFGVVLCALPNAFYPWVFGSEFSELKTVILILLPGVYLDNIAMVTANYFAAINKLKITNYRALLGLILIVVLCGLCLPQYGLMGAAWATSLSYGLSALFLMYCFYQRAKFHFSDFFPTQKQIHRFLGKRRI